MADKAGVVPCPVCNREFPQDLIEDHVHKCLFLNTQSSSAKRDNSHFTSPSNKEKRPKTANATKSLLASVKNDTAHKILHTPETSKGLSSKKSAAMPASVNIPLAERMRPTLLDDIFGQESFGPGTMLRSMLEQLKIPNMILWGPPGCGKTSLANVVSGICKEQNNLRFVKLSATVAGINDVKEVVKIAKNELQYKRQTVLFMDEIHRFNKLQQDTFLPHVENGTIILIGATTENPSFSLNSALLSRCRVVVMAKLSTDNIMKILEKAIEQNKQERAVIEETGGSWTGELDDDNYPSFMIERGALRWLAEVSDGDARVALGGLEMALASRPPPSHPETFHARVINTDDMKEGIKRSHMLYDARGEEHYNIISAVHKSIRAGDDNAALYWTTRAMTSGEDPMYLARRLVRAAYEDIGLADGPALVEAVSALRGARQLGAPECDVLLAHTAVRLARAPKSTEVYRAMKRCRRSLAEGPLPPVPLHLRNAPTKLMGQLGYGRGYNTRLKEESGLTYMPEGMEHVDFFRDDDKYNGDG